MPIRKTPIDKDELYHIVNKSIAGFKIFNIQKDYERMVDALIFYNIENPPCRFFQFKKLKNNPKLACFRLDYPKKLVKIITYCIMPTHIHLILKEIVNNGISKFIGNLLNSYSKYFNIKYNRKGPLWEGRFNNILIKTDEQFLHDTSYIHLNPVTAGLVDKPEDWIFSSYREYIGIVDRKEGICEYQNFFDMEKDEYKKFVESRISYQKEMASAKRAEYLNR